MRRRMERKAKEYMNLEGDGDAIVVCKLQGIMRRKVERFKVIYMYIEVSMIAHAAICGEIMIIK